MKYGGFKDHVSNPDSIFLNYGFAKEEFQEVYIK